ncbi:hypothetical protein L3X38_045488 [Prunus dulcis]|uniref:Uncharacterized protein n=1 Tax=Prunus dulcis TaxID=3755 RepID=A0AAD4US56_PRUDU|nr:hypothetical protein L3X38_045488 [Prunus dulcis]
MTGCLRHHMRQKGEVLKEVLKAPLSPNDGGVPNDEACEGKSPSLVVFRCGTPLALLRVVICGDASLAKVMTSQSMALE